MTAKDHATRINPALFIRAAAGLYGLPVDAVLGPSRRVCRAQHLARSDAVRMGLDAGYSRADMARALGLDWASVDALGKRKAPGA